MSKEISDADRKKVLKLGIVSQELALLSDQSKKWRAQQRVLVIDLVQREILSQARASRITELSRQSIASWVNVHPADYESAQERADAIVAADDSLVLDPIPPLHAGWPIQANADAFQDPPV